MGSLLNRFSNPEREREREREIARKQCDYPQKACGTVSKLFTTNSYMDCVFIIALCGTVYLFKETP